MNTSVIIVAAGRGERFGGSFLPKPFFPLGGKPILAYVLEAFEKVDEVTETIVVLRPEMMGAAWEKNLGNSHFKKLKEVTPGGATRADSVWEGLQKISKAQEIVLVHDGARPLLKPSLIEAVIHAAREWGAAVPGLPVKPTIKEVDSGGFVVKTHSRERLWEAQTPQGFRAELLREAFRKAGPNRAKATDDAFLVEQMGAQVKVVEGDPNNIKITTQDDLKWAEYLLANHVSVLG